MKLRFLAKLSIAILVPIAMGLTYAVGTHGDAEQARIAMAERAVRASQSRVAVARQIAAALRVARAKCQALIGADRGNCRTEARAEAKRALRDAREHPPSA
jgi:hypothetical protein